MCLEISKTNTRPSSGTTQSVSHSNHLNPLPLHFTCPICSRVQCNRHQIMHGGCKRGVGGWVRAGLAKSLLIVTSIFLLDLARVRDCNPTPKWVLSLSPALSLPCSLSHTLLCLRYCACSASCLCISLVSISFRCVSFPFASPGFRSLSLSLSYPLFLYYLLSLAPTVWCVLA